MVHHLYLQEKKKFQIVVRNNVFTCTLHTIFFFHAPLAIHTRIITTFSLRTYMLQYHRRPTIITRISIRHLWPIFFFSQIHFTNEKQAPHLLLPQKRQPTNEKYSPGIISTLHNKTIYCVQYCYYPPPPFLFIYYPRLKISPTKNSPRDPKVRSTKVYPRRKGFLGGLPPERLVG